MDSEPGAHSDEETFGRKEKSKDVARDSPPVDPHPGKHGPVAPIKMSAGVSWCHPYNKTLVGNGCRYDAV